MSDEARILNETAASTPAIVRHADRLFYLVWSGGGGAGDGPPNFKINTVRAEVLPHDEREYFDKTVLDAETTAEGLALTSGGRWLYLAWRGLDGAGRVNVMRGYPVGEQGNPSDPDAHWWDKTTLGETCIGAPALTYYQGQLVLAWTGGGGFGGGPPDRRLNLAWSNVIENGLSWDPANHVVLDESSDTGPALTVVGDLHGRGPHLTLAWTGGDARLHYISWVGGAPLDATLLDKGNKLRETLDDTSQQSPTVWNANTCINIGWVGVGNRRVNLNGGDAWGTSLFSSEKTVSGDTSSGGLCIAADPQLGAVAAYQATNGHQSIVLAPGGHYGAGWAKP